MSPIDHDLLVFQNKKEVIVEGVFQAIGYSSTKKTMYLLFSKNGGSSDFRGAVSAKDAIGGLSESGLGSISGKKIRLKGEIRIESVGSIKRPVIDIKKRSEIESAE